MLIHIAPVPAHPLRRRGTPARRVRTVGQRVRGDGAGGEEPDVDLLARPLHGVNAATVGVEAVAEGRGSAGLDAAAVGGHHGAVGAGVQGRGVGGLVVDAFDDVDFAGRVR